MDAAIAVPKGQLFGVSRAVRSLYTRCGRHHPMLKSFVGLKCTVPSKRTLLDGKPSIMSLKLRNLGNDLVWLDYRGVSTSWRGPKARLSNVMFSKRVIVEEDFESQQLHADAIDTSGSRQGEVGGISSAHPFLIDLELGTLSHESREDGDPHGSASFSSNSMNMMVSQAAVTNGSEAGVASSKRPLSSTANSPSQRSTNSLLRFSSTTVAAHPPVPKKLPMTPADQAFLCLGFIAVALSGSISALLLMAIPTLRAMKKAAESVEKLADTAREELPGTMAALRLSGMEISDLTMELSDLSQDIGEGLRSSARAVQAAEDGLRRMGSFATNSTLTLLQTHATLPVEAVKPAAAAAAQTTRQAIENARKMLEELAILNFVVGWVNWGGTTNKEGGEARKEPRSEIPAGESAVVLVQRERMSAEAVLKGDVIANGQAIIREPNGD